MQRTTTSDGLRIAYEDTGSGSPALVFIHGAYANRSHYAAQVKHFAAQHRVLVPDLRGHGESDSPQGAFGIREAARDVLAVCDAAGVTSAVVCGHSFPVALRVAEARPSLIAGVVLIDGALLLPQPLREEIVSTIVPALESPGWAAAMQGFLISRNFPYEASALKARVADEIAHGPANLGAQMMRDVMSTDWSAELTSNSAPLLYVHGGMPLDLQRLRHLRPDAIVGVVAGAGHYMTLEVPDQVNAMIDRFLELSHLTDTNAQTPAATRTGAPDWVAERRCRGVCVTRRQA